MEIIPLAGNEIITAGTISIQVNAADRARAEALVARTGLLVVVNDQVSFTVVKRAAGELKALINEIDDSRKAAKRPFTAVEKAIDELALEVGQPVMDEQKRVLGLLNGYVAQQEAAQKEEARAKAAAQAKIEEAKREELRRAKELLAKAEAEARAAKDEAERKEKQAEAQRRAEVAEAAKLSAELAGEIATIGDKPKRGLVPGGRVDHKYEFKLVDVQATVRAGAWRLLSWKLDHLACQDSCRGQLELNPDAEPTLPGIEVTRSVNVSVRASAKIG